MSDLCLFKVQMDDTCNSVYGDIGYVYGITAFEVCLEWFTYSATIQAFILETGRVKSNPFSLTTSQEIGEEERLQNDLFCVRVGQ